jgi:hypothetical protein
MSYYLFVVIYFITEGSLYGSLCLISNFTFLINILNKTSCQTFSEKKANGIFVNSIFVNGGIDCSARRIINVPVYSIQTLKLR